MHANIELICYFLILQLTPMFDPMKYTFFKDLMLVNNGC
jgi:hypothetical protein